MPRRFLQSEYQKLSKKELIDAIYKMAHRADDSFARALRAQCNARRLRDANKRLRESNRVMRTRIAQLTPAA